MTTTTDIDQLCINTIRTLAIDAVEQAKSGHPGAPMGMAPMAYVLWTRFLKHNPRNPAWADRDRFVLSAGHASMLLYSLLHLTGYDVDLDEVRAFRQWGSLTPGHPESGHTPGVEVTTGPLGAGFAMAVGMAIAEGWLAARYNRDGHTVVDHYTYGICSDGDLMEGVASEAASLAGTLRLGKLIMLYDDNGITIDGETDLTFTEDVGQRFAAYGWHVEEIDGNDLDMVGRAIEAAQEEARRPSLIIAHTQIGEGSPNKAGTPAAHGTALGAEEVKLTKEALGWPLEPAFHVPEAAASVFRSAIETGRAAEGEWDEQFAAYERDHPDLAQDWRMATTGMLPEGWTGTLPAFEVGAEVETRVASGQTLNAIAPVITNLVGGSSDLAGSNNTLLKEYPALSEDEPGGRNIYFGVREHAMGGILNGMACHGGIVPYGGTFLTFSDYMRPAIRLAAVMQAKPVFVFTHDSIGLGEDGPTHQPIEHLASLRAMPGLSVIRPADANETSAAWAVALERQGPTALALTRQKVPVLVDHETAMRGVTCGAYTVAGADDTPDVILLATGSEVAIAMDAREVLAAEGVAARVVSMPAWDRFAAQAPEYQESVLPRAVRARVAVEAGASLGWHQWVGLDGAVVGIDRFGASAPYKTIYRELGLTAERVAEVARAVIGRTR